MGGAQDQEREAGCAGDFKLEEKKKEVEAEGCEASGGLNGLCVALIALSFFCLLFCLPLV